MDGKYGNLASFLLAVAVRKWTRYKLRDAISWEKPENLRDGCTVVIGMPHQLPNVLPANLACLFQNRWPELRRTLIIVDSTDGCLPSDLMRRLKNEYAELAIEFVFYDKIQDNIAKELRFPYVYAWLSWCVGLRMVDTKHVLLHDYDALLLRPCLGSRYEKIARSGKSIQGIKWYESNGIRASDRLATTFEAFLDVAWVRKFHPLMLFNQVALHNGRSVDYDTMLEIQARYTPEEMRDVVGMSEDEVVHPSQMIHQYTMFRRFPGKALPCFSLAMIPFFNWLSGDRDALLFPTERLNAASSTVLDFLEDGTVVNLKELNAEMVDWNLKQMIRACEGLEVAPSGDLILYGNALYRMANTAVENCWCNGFTETHLKWIAAAKTDL